MNFDPITPVSLTFTPAVVEGEAPFADVKRRFPDFQALRDEYDTFAEMIADNPGTGPGF